MGLGADPMHDGEDPVIVRLKVGDIGATKVRGKVKGTMRMSGWTEIRRGVAKRYDVLGGDGKTLSQTDDLMVT